MYSIQTCGVLSRGLGIEYPHITDETENVMCIHKEYAKLMKIPNQKEII